MSNHMSDADTDHPRYDRSALKRLPLFSLSPPLGRGISWALDPDTYLLANDEYEIDAWT